MEYRKGKVSDEENVLMLLKAWEISFFILCLFKIVDVPQKLVFENFLYDIESDLSILVNLQRFTPKHFPQLILVICIF